MWHQCTLLTGIVEGAPAVVVVVVMEEAWLLLVVIYRGVGRVVVRARHIAVVF